MEVGFCFSLYLLPHCVFHAFIQKVKLLLNRIYLPFSAFLGRLSPRLLLLGLIRLFFGKQSVQLASASLLVIGDIETWEAIDVLTVVFL